MHAFLSTLIEAHTPLSSPLSTPLVGPGTPFPMPSDAPRGMAIQTPIAPKDPGSGTVLVCTHEANILALLKLLLEPEIADDKPFNEGVMSDIKANQQEADYFVQAPQDKPSLHINTAVEGTDSVSATPFGTHAKLRKIVMAHTSNTVDMTKQCGNTALCVVRVWWEPMTEGLKACGRVEAWGDVDHLDD